MTVPTLPTAPSRAMDQDTFDAAVDAWVAALANWTAVVNAMGITTLTGSIQSTPIGNVTPSTGAFTTLSSTDLAVTGSISSTTSNTVLTSYAASQNNNIGLITSGGQMGMGMRLQSSSGGVYSRAFYSTESSIEYPVMSISSTGLAVTGSISSTTTSRTGGYTVATLPAASQGARAYVTDATAPTYLGALTGGGAVVCPVFKNATAWVSA